MRLLNRSHLLSLVVAFLFVSGCATQNSAADSKAEKKAATAKINAQLGIAYLEQHNVQRAKQKLLLALKEGPKVSEAWYSMGYFLEVTGAKAEAKKYYLKAVELAPDQGEPQNNYGTYLCRSGQYKEAVQHFLLAVKDPDYINSADAYENAGLCALKIPDNTLAMQYFRLAINQDPDHPVSLLELAELSYLQKDYASAKTYLNLYEGAAPPSEQSIRLAAELSKYQNSSTKRGDIGLLHSHLTQPHSQGLSRR